MKKTIKYIAILFLIILSIIIVRIAFLLPDFISSIEIGSALPLTPRPDTIPEKALWVGGLDGGVYVLVQKNSKDSPAIYDAAIYYDSGDVSYQGRLVINTPDHPQFNYDDVNSYAGWDGDTLYLQDGRQLTIAAEHGD
ncbi:MAG: hypothetical protein L3J89_11480 [Gammaproteobacteria bacterium]|nr:hypothetical protein [Gammaproteobacteria bacterium]